MSVEQAASAETTLAAASGRGETRILGPIAVGLALLSAFVTFVVLVIARILVARVKSF